MDCAAYAKDVGGGPSFSVTRKVADVPPPRFLDKGAVKLWHSPTWYVWILWFREKTASQVHSLWNVPQKKIPRVTKGKRASAHWFLSEAGKVSVPVPLPGAVSRSPSFVGTPKGSLLKNIVTVTRMRKEGVTLICTH